VTEKLAGTVTTGGVVSTRLTVIVKPPDAVFECESVAEHETVVSPTGNRLPDDGLQLGVIGPSTSSLAEAVYETVFPDALSVVTAKSDGKVRTGGVVSTTAARVTVTVNDACPVFEWASVAEQVTVVAPIGKVLPESWSHVGVSVPSTVSVAVADGYETAVPAGFEVSTATSAGTVTVGEVVSPTVTVKVLEYGSPASVVVEQVTVVSSTGK
jgi:hypothetical protein